MQALAFAPYVEMPFERTYTLVRNISAIQVLPSEDGSNRLGLITQLPQGVEVTVGGIGFNESTVRVLCGGGSYFVFLEDLDPVKKHVASSALA